MEILKAEIAGLIEQFRTIISATKTINLKGGMAGLGVFLNELDNTKMETLISEFNSLVHETNAVSRKLGSSFYLSTISGLKLRRCTEAARAITEIQSRGSKAIAFLEKAMAPTLSKDQIDKFRSLREESLKIDDINCQKNLLKAIEESEQAHHLGSALIASRVIVYVLEKIPGKDDEEKVDNLFQKGLIPEKREDVRSSLLRACRLARNTLSHRIEIFPDPDEVLSILANSVTLSKLETKFKSVFQSL
jgi:hypothetical protein